MKTLYLIRHAKASRDDPSLPDRERPLAERGQRDAPLMGKRLAKRGVKPDLILSSPALRALATAELMADELGYKRKRILVDDRIYAAQPDVLLEILSALDDQFACVMVFGHNPEMSELAQVFSDDIGDLPTCAVVEIAFNAVHWAEIDPGTVATVTFDYPKKDAG
jgi:phosphohistidine phosphatase